jgi:pimeloyl-ACP methyl ester carboxylesterase
MKPHIFELSAMHTLNTPNGVLAYRMSPGSGLPVVLLHTNSSSSAIYQPLLDSALGQQYRLIAVDFPGHGDSSDADEPQRDYTIPAYARQVSALIAALELKQAAVIGCSLGGHVALELAAQQPDQVCGLIIMGTPPVGPGVDHMDRAFIPTEHMALTGLASWTQEQAAQYGQACMGDIPLSADLHAVFARADGRARERMFSHWQSGAEGYDQRAFVADSATPLAVLHGGADPFISYDYLESLQWGNLWREQIHQLKAAGHMPFLQAPAEFERLTSEFLATL